MGFQITERDDPEGIRCLTPAGELDIATGPELQQRLRELGAAHRRVRLDLSQLDFMDSSGISAILLGLQDAGRNGWELEIDPRVSPAVARLIEISGIGQQFWPRGTS